MNQRAILILGVLAVVLIAGGAYLAWDWALGETEAASAPIQAQSLEIEPTSQPAGATDMADGGEASAPAEGAASASGPIIFQISQEGSEVRFTIFEELRNQPKDVVGVTDQIAGEIAVDPRNLDQTQVGVIQVNARTLVTDEDRRNQAIRNRILHTDTYEFITFTPTAIAGLSGSASPGSVFEFQISGDLTIRDITNPVVFDVTAQLVTEDQISGSASTVINRNDYDLAIPSVPFVANVGQDITLEIEFVANPSGE